jgi:hypothetical protein
VRLIEKKLIYRTKQFDYEARVQETEKGGDGYSSVPRVHPQKPFLDQLARDSTDAINARCEKEGGKPALADNATLNWIFSTHRPRDCPQAPPQRQKPHVGHDVSVHLVTKVSLVSYHLLQAEIHVCTYIRAVSTLTCTWYNTLAACGSSLERLT